MTRGPAPDLGGALSSVATMRVLAVDDIPANTRLIRRILQEAGITAVVELNDARGIEQALSEVDPDLVLLDIKMPGLDGYEVLPYVQRHAAGSFLPVIVISADSSNANTTHALDLGAHDFVSKPFDAAELVLRVRNLLRTRAAYQELRRSRSWMLARLDMFDAGITAVEDDPDAVRLLITTTMRDDAVQVALQPIVDMRDGTLVGFEALSRFPASVLPHPGAWFVAAEQLGLAVELETHALRKACRLLGGLPEGTTLSLNVSPRTVLDGLPDTLGEDLDWSRLVFELTEHVPVEDYEALQTALDRLRERGARLAIDDAGAGFASLRHIVNLTPDIIKLDIGITRGVDSDPSRSAIAEMVTRFAERVDIRVIAEGVETPEERDTLIALGLTLGQGYLFGRPTIAG